MINSTDNILYRMERAGGRHYMQRINEPTGVPTNANYLITWRGLDWSGFMTLAKALEHIPGLETRAQSTDVGLYHNPDYAIVER